MIGILPAAGKAERIYGLPKFLLPIPGGYLLQRHVDMMRCAGLTHNIRERSSIFIPTSPQNYPYIVGREFDNMVYGATPRDTMTQTVLSAFSAFTEGEKVLFGMPDTYIEDDECYSKLVTALECGLDIAAGVFHTRPEQRQKLGMCRVEFPYVTEVIDKPKDTKLEWAWGVLAWRPVFWKYLDPADPHVGYGLPRALEAGLEIGAVTMRGGYWDCGTYDEFVSLTRYLHS